MTYQCSEEARLDRHSLLKWGESGSYLNSHEGQVRELLDKASDLHAFPSVVEPRPAFYLHLQGKKMIEPRESDWIAASRKVIVTYCNVQKNFYLGRYALGSYSIVPFLSVHLWGIFAFLDITFIYVCYSKWAAALRLASCWSDSTNHSSPRKLQAMSTSPLYTSTRYFCR